MLGGLQVLNKVLTNMEQTPQISEAKRKINVMLNGGITVNGFETVGLLSFIYNGSFDKSRRAFYTHGIAKTPSSMTDWQPYSSAEPGAMAVDINTWGMSALGVETVDKWFGEGTALTIWHNVRNKGGYFSSHSDLWGVGYTLNNNAQTDPEHIMSTEWTAGAINSIESLLNIINLKTWISMM
jgi:hypothetical protein